MNGTIVVVTHKEYTMPKKSLYLPVCVGVGRDILKDKYQPDDEGKNISDKNILYCELTALYWAWKNLECDFIGLAHYRRYLSKKRNGRTIDDALTKEEVESLLLQCDIILMRKKEYTQSIAEHYINCIRSRKEAHKVHLKLLRETIKEISPSYIAEYDKTMNGHEAHMLNIFIMRKVDLDSYCEWLFNIMFSLESKIYDNNVYYDRIMGAFSEFLLDVWLKTNGKTYIEMNLVETEKNHFAKLKWALKRRLLE